MKNAKILSLLAVLFLSACGPVNPTSGEESKQDSTLTEKPDVTQPTSEVPPVEVLHEIDQVKAKEMVTKYLETINAENYKHHEKYSMQISLKESIEEDTHSQLAHGRYKVDHVKDQIQVDNYVGFLTQDSKPVESSWLFTRNNELTLATANANIKTYQVIEEDFDTYVNNNALFSSVYYGAEDDQAALFASMVLALDFEKDPRVLEHSFKAKGENEMLFSFKVEIKEEIKSTVSKYVFHIIDNEIMKLAIDAEIKDDKGVANKTTKVQVAYDYSEPTINIPTIDDTWVKDNGENVY